MAMRASSAAESPVIYVLLSESSRFKSEVSGQDSCHICLCMCVCVCVRMCERESVYFSQPHAINLNVCICVRRCMRASPKFSAGCPSLFDLEWLHSFDCGHAWKAFGAVKIMTSSQRWSHLCMSCADWLT